MLHEYGDVFSAVTEILDALKSIADGSGHDAIKLSDAVTSADNLANLTFGGNKEYVPAIMVATKEAWDFVSAHSRMSDIYQINRARAYELAAEEFSADKSRMQYYDAVLKTLDRFGA